MKKVALLLSGAALLFAVAARAEISVENPYVRAMPPGQTVTGAFMLLKNTADEKRAVVRAESSVAGIVELHTHINEDGVMKMRQIPQIDIDAQSTTELKPGGLHVMLIDVPNQLNEGDQVDIKLVFDDGTDQLIQAPVKSVTGGMMHGKGAQHGNGGMPMGRGGKGMAIMKHANPMPNYMQVVMKMGDQLDLTEAQQQALKEWRTKNGPVVDALAESIIESEQQLAKLSMSGASVEEIKSAAEKSLALRMEMIERKTNCRENMRNVLDEAQFDKVVTLYQGMTN